MGQGRQRSECQVLANPGSAACMMRHNTYMHNSVHVCMCMPQKVSENFLYGSPDLSRILRVLAWVLLCVCFSLPNSFCLVCLPGYGAGVSSRTGVSEPLIPLRPHGELLNLLVSLSCPMGHQKVCGRMSPPDPTSLGLPTLWLLPASGDTHSDPLDYTASSAC